MIKGGKSSSGYEIKIVINGDPDSSDFGEFIRFEGGASSGDTGDSHPGNPRCWRKGPPGGPGGGDNPTCVWVLHNGRWYYCCTS